jgi:hypothetical protein
MADNYHSFNELSQNETAGMAFYISVRRARRSFAIVAPHGGGIEPGTSEIANAIAAKEFSYYAFDGLKVGSGNADLHITSTRFDEPMCLTLIGNSNVVLTIHGEESEVEGGAVAVFLGGLDDRLVPAWAPRLRPKALMFADTRILSCKGVSPKTCVTEGLLARASSWSCPGLFEGKCSCRYRRRAGSTQPLDFVDALRSALNDEAQPHRAFEQGRG